MVPEGVLQAVAKVQGRHYLAIFVLASAILSYQILITRFFSVILFYRGSWCPYCNAQLRAFQRSLDRLTGLGVLVAAVSVDDEATTKNLIAKHGLQFPIGHSADARAVYQAP